MFVLALCTTRGIKAIYFKHQGASRTHSRPHIHNTSVMCSANCYDPLEKVPHEPDITGVGVSICQTSNDEEENDNFRLPWPIPVRLLYHSLWFSSNTSSPTTQKIALPESQNSGVTVQTQSTNTYCVGGCTSIALQGRYCRLSRSQMGTWMSL